MGLNNSTVLQSVSVLAQDGTGNFSGSNSAALQEAVSYLEAVGGGILYVKGGEYTFNEKITKTTDYDVQIVGHGRATVFKAKNNLNDNMIEITGDNFSISNLKIDGNGSNQSLAQNVGICIKATSCDNVNVDNLRITNIPYKGILFDLCTNSDVNRTEASDVTSTSTISYIFQLEQCINSGFSHCKAHDSARTGFAIKDLYDTKTYYGCYYQACTAYSVATGFLVHEISGITINNCTAYSCTIDGLSIYGSSSGNQYGYTISNSTFRNNTGDGMNVQIATKMNVSACNFLNNSNTGITLNGVISSSFNGNNINSNLADGINVATCFDCTFTGGTIISNGNGGSLGWGVNENTASNANSFLGIRTDLNGLGNYLIVGADTEVSHNNIA